MNLGRLAVTRIGSSEPLAGPPDHRTAAGPRTVALPTTALRHAVAGAIVALGVLGAAHAEAQEKTFYLDRLQMSGAPDDGYTVWRPYKHEETRFYGTFTLGWTQNPLRDETVVDADTDDGQDLLREIGNPVGTQIITYLAVGMEVASRVGVNVQLPIGLFMAGDDPAETGIDGAPNAPVSTAALHDLRLDARLALLEKDGLRLGLNGALWLNTGDPDSFAGDDLTTGAIYPSIEYDFDGKFLLAAHLGPHFRPQRGVTNSPLQVASELRWALGGYVPLKDDTIRLGAEIWGSEGIQNSNGEDASFTGRNTDLEWLAQGRFAIDEKKRTWVNAGAGTRLSKGYGAPDIRVLAQIGYWFPIKDKEPPAPARRWRAAPEVEETESDRDGDGFPDDIDKCPDIPEDGAEPEPTDGCPAGADRDGDGIPDDMDRCPDTPEDKDGVEDDDGCPEKDADNDTIPDAEDKCPTEPGPASAIAEKHGCPSLTRIDDETGEIALLEPIQFEYNSAAIKPVSFPILDEVVGVMKARENLRIGVYGHTDSRGSDVYNLNLSKRRAASVMKYLNEHGIQANRLESEGYGETKPKCNEETQACWDVNRRVEFKMLN